MVGSMPVTRWPYVLPRTLACLDISGEFRLVGADGNLLQGQRPTSRLMTSMPGRKGQILDQVQREGSHGSDYRGCRGHWGGNS